MTWGLWGMDNARTAAWGGDKQAPRFVYHNASESSRESILRDGLLPGYDQTAPAGEEDEHGGAYASDTARPEWGGDWWRIDTSKLPRPPVTDWTTDPEDENENWYFIPGGVPPHALTLHHPHTAARLAMPTWHHLTDDPEFRLNPDAKPRRPYGHGEFPPGVFLTQRPDEWAYTEDDGSWSGDRPYVADIDAPDDLHTLPGVWHDPDGDRPTDKLPGSEETFVPADQFHHLTVKNVRPRNASRLAMPAPKFPDFGHQLPHVGPMEGADMNKNVDSMWANGYCGHLALAFKNMWPDLKIGAEIDNRNGGVNHAWVHDGKHAHDAYGTHENEPAAWAPNWSNSIVNMDIDPQELADKMGIKWSPDEDDQWDDPIVHMASGEIEQHWLGYDPETETYGNNPKEARIMTAAVTVYTKPDCPQCTMTKKQLDRLGIEHTTVDVTADPEAHAYVTGLGYQQAPVVVVGDGERHWGGFSPDKLKGLIE